jgi:hypothetical protein
MSWGHCRVCTTVPLTVQPSLIAALIGAVFNQRCAEAALVLAVAANPIAQANAAQRIEPASDVVEQHRDSQHDVVQLTTRHCQDRTTKCQSATVEQETNHPSVDIVAFKARGADHGLLLATRTARTHKADPAHVFSIVWKIVPDQQKPQRYLLSIFDSRPESFRSRCPGAKQNHRASTYRLFVPLSCLGGASIRLGSAVSLITARQGAGRQYFDDALVTTFNPLENGIPALTDSIPTPG